MAGPCELDRVMLTTGNKKPLYQNGKINIPANTEKFLKMYKNLWDNNYTAGAASKWDWEGVWSDNMSNEKTVGYFGPEWFLDFTYTMDGSVKKKNIGIVEGPAASYWGGTGMTVTNKVKNKGLTQLFLYTVTADSAFLAYIGKKNMVCPNNKTAMKKMIKSGYGKKRGYANDPYVVWDKVAKKIKVQPATIYDDEIISEVVTDVPFYLSGIFGSSPKEVVKMIKINLKKSIQ